MSRKVFRYLLPLLALGIAGTALIGPAANRSATPPAPTSNVNVASHEAILPLPSPADDPLPPLPCAPDVVLPEVLYSVNPPSFPPETVVIFATPAFACEEQVITLPVLTPVTVEELANALDGKVKVDAYEAAEISIYDAAGNVLAVRSHPRVPGHSPEAGDRKELTIYSAYTADGNGRILTGTAGLPIPAADAVPIGTIAVGNACTNQNVRIALQGFATFVANLN